MKFLVDAQLPRRFCDWLWERGHDALHTLDLELGNQTPDSDKCSTRIGSEVKTRPNAKK